MEMNSSQNAKKRQKSKTSVIVTILVLAVVAYLAVAFIGLLSDINEASASVNSEQLKLEAIKAENAALAESQENESYIKEFARENGYVNPGEEVYEDISGN